MPKVTPLGITYQPHETVWGYEKPVAEVVSQHEWKQTGAAQEIPNEVTGETDMLYEWAVMHVNEAAGPVPEKTPIPKAAKIAAGIGLAWWLLG